MKVVHTEIEIDAKPEAVWAVLIDFASYSTWNPFMRSVRGVLRLGAMLDVTARVHDGPLMSFRPRLLCVDPPRELRWLGALPIPFLFQGEHMFRIEPCGEGKSRFIHSEKFEGLLMPVMGWLLRRNRVGYMKMNEALKARVEGRKG